MSDSYQVSWLVPERVILITATHLDSDNLQTINQQILDMMADCPYPLVHHVWDLRDLETFPKNVRVIADALSSMLMHDKYGWAITVADDRLVQYLAHVVTSIYKVRYRNFESYEEALDFLHEMDRTLPDDEIAAD